MRIGYFQRFGNMETIRNNNFRGICGNGNYNRFILYQRVYICSIDYQPEAKEPQ
jgi:hypothetical protein